MSERHWFTRHVETIFGGKLGSKRETRAPVALLPATASPSMPCWVECIGDERADCQDCEHAFDEYSDRYVPCDTCGGDGERLSLDDILARFTPADFGVRRDADGSVYRDLNHEGCPHE